MCLNSHHHAHGVGGPNCRTRLLKIQALPLSVSAGHQTRLVSPIPLVLKCEEALQRMLPFQQVNLVPHPKHLTRPKLLRWLPATCWHPGKKVPQPLGRAWLCAPRVATAAVKAAMFSETSRLRQCHTQGTQTCLVDVAFPPKASLVGLKRLRSAVLAEASECPCGPPLLSPRSCRLPLHHGLVCFTSVSHIGSLTLPFPLCLCPCTPHLPFGNLHQVIPSYAALLH
jgi:hypothetical protein